MGHRFLSRTTETYTRWTSRTIARTSAPGPLLAGALADLAALEEGAYERAVAKQILVDLEHVLETKPSPTPEEEEFVVNMQGTWTDARRIGRDEGRTEEAAHALLTVLRARRVAVPDDARERILAEKDRVQLERWLERASLAVSVAEVFDEASRAA